MPTMTEHQTMSLTAGTWLVGRLIEYRGKLGLPTLDLDVPFLVSMPADTDGALMTGAIGIYTLANMHAGPALDLPAPTDGAFDPVRVGTSVERSAQRRTVALADCHDVAALLTEASILMNRDNRISDDTHACLLESIERMSKPYETIAA
jgi:hypothetical protein